MILPNFKEAHAKCGFAALNGAHPELIAARLTAIEQRIDHIGELVNALHAGVADLLAAPATIDAPASEHAQDAHDRPSAWGLRW